MKTRYGILAGIILLIISICGTAVHAAETGSDDIAPYTGMVGADSPLYGLKIAWEDLDETFTANDTERIEKQMIHARLRLSEVKREFAENRPESAQAALDQYWQKVNLTEMQLGWSRYNATGILHAQEMHATHQRVLEDLMLAHPNNTGLMRAYNNSLLLGEKFEEKSRVRFGKILEADNKTIQKAYRIGIQKEHQNGNGTADGEEIREQVRKEERVHVPDTTSAENAKTPGGQDNGNSRGKKQG